MTKSWQIFEGKIRNLKQHTQLLDLTLSLGKQKCAQIRKANKSKGTIGKDLGAGVRDHLHLNHPNDVKNLLRVFAYSRSKVNEQSVVDLYKIFSDYMVNIITEIFASNPHRMIGLVPNKDDRQMNFIEILNAGNYNALKDQMAVKIYRSLEKQKSTPKLLDKLIKATGANIPNNVKSDALLYLEIRHLIIHNNSKADGKFNQMNIAGKVHVNQANNKLKINYNLTNAAITAVYVLCKTLDEQIVALGLV